MWIFRAKIRLPDGGPKRVHAVPGVGRYADLPRTKIGAEEAGRREIARVRSGAASTAEEVPSKESETVESYANRWLDAREGRVHSIRDERSRFRLHILPAIGSMPLSEVRPRHVRDLILGIRGKLAPRTVRGVYGTLHTMFRDAEIDELVASNPVKVSAGTLPKKVDKDPAWRSTAVFTREEVEALISDERIPTDRRVLYAILGLSGMRFGEVAALRWSAYDRAQEPLGMLSVHVAFEVRSKKEKEVKTGVARRVPVHPTLRAILAEWKLATQPGAGDLIIPSKLGEHRRVWRSLLRFHEDLDRLGLRRRRLHDLRRTFITLAQVDGARRDLLEVITHGPRGDIVSAYTTYPWSALCAEVAKLSIARAVAAVWQQQR
jgi:integrase